MFYRKSMLVIDGKYNNEDGMSTGRMQQMCTRDEINSLPKLKRDSILRISGGSKVEALDTKKFFQVRRMHKLGRRSISDHSIPS
jgi:hypothetical protein